MEARDKKTIDWMMVMNGIDDWIGLDWIGLDWIGLDWIGLDWIGLDWIGLDCCRHLLVDLQLRAFRLANPVVLLLTLTHA